IQTQTESETKGVGGADQYRVAQAAFDERGAVKVKTLPTFQTVPAGQTAPVYFRLSASGFNCSYFQYDPIGRVASVRQGCSATFSTGLLASAPSAQTDTDSPLGPILTSYVDSSNPWVKVVTDQAGSVIGLVRKFTVDGFGRV